MAKTENYGSGRPLRIEESVPVMAATWKGADSTADWASLERLVSRRDLRIRGAFVDVPGPCSCGWPYEPQKDRVLSVEIEVETEEREPNPRTDNAIHRRATGRERIRHNGHEWGPWTEVADGGR